MKYMGLWTLLVSVYCSGIAAAPTQLRGERSMPMGNVKPSQNLKDSASSAPALNEYMISDMPVRFQWFANHGYCGEMSLISAGLKYGQYVSQYTARSTVSGDSQQTQVLLGVNADAAADAMHLQYAPQWNAHNTPEFLSWIKAYVLNDYPVIIGVYTNECLFCLDCKNCQSHGDREYDHIVSVLGVRSFEPLTPPALPPAALPSYIESDTIIFSDHGLQGPDNYPIKSPCLPNPSNPYQFAYTFKQFQATRQRANTNNRWYSLSTATPTYGIAILGIRDDDHDTIPVNVETLMTEKKNAKGMRICPLRDPSIDTYINYEYPSIVNQSDAKPAPMPLTLKISVTINDPSQSYNVYRYNDLSQIPDSHFNMHAASASEMWVIPPGAASPYVFTQQIMSDEVAAYRAVATSAP